MNLTRAIATNHYRMMISVGLVSSLQPRISVVLPVFGFNGKIWSNGETQSRNRLLDWMSHFWSNGGYEMQEGNDLIVCVEIAPQGKLGGLVARVELADSDQPTNRVRASFKTTYSALDLFKSDLARLMAEQTDRAELLGREST